MTTPTLDLERTLGRRVVGMDEVGRGAVAGPVAVGAVLIDTTTGPVPDGLRDSKLLSPARREGLCDPVRAWCVAWAVGSAAASEVDALGIIAALRLAGRRALASLDAPADVILLDGTHEWLTDPMAVGLLGDGADSLPPVTVRPKADRTCASVAAASVLAKVERDAVMRDLHERHPQYGFAGNKGYASAEHVAALAAHGPCAVHRVSWRLPGVVYGGADAKEQADER